MASLNPMVALTALADVNVEVFAEVPPHSKTGPSRTTASCPRIRDRVRLLTGLAIEHAAESGITAGRSPMPRPHQEMGDIRER
jgi:hypothetical protein